MRHLRAVIVIFLGLGAIALPGPLTPSLEAQEPARYLIQIGPVLTMPTGEFAAVDPATGGLATSDFGIGARGVITLTRRFALFISWTRHAFGFDSVMYEDYLGQDVWDVEQRVDAVAGGLRYYIPTVEEHRPYFQGGIGSYRYEISGIRDQSPFGHADDPAFGFTLGGGTILPLGGFALDLSFALHSTRFTFVEGLEGGATWLLFSGWLTIPIW
jgi:hypothetical protein